MQCLTGCRLRTRLCTLDCMQYIDLIAFCQAESAAAGHPGLECAA